MKIYTKTGDKGFTSLTGGKRVRKDDQMVEAYGTVDEANSMLGLAISRIDDPNLEKVKSMLVEVQKDLFHVGAELSTPQDVKVYWPLSAEQVNKIEKYIDDLDGELPELRNFILPGGTEVAAVLHVARSIIRRAERSAIEINNEQVLSYLNRCSDFLFVAARWINLKEGEQELDFIP